MFKYIIMHVMLSYIHNTNDFLKNYRFDLFKIRILS